MEDNQKIMDPIEAMEAIGETTAKLGRRKKDEVFVYSKAIRKYLGIKFTPFKRKSKKIGRNEVCPCGSGLKYKNCCISKEEKTEYKNKIDNEKR